MTHQPTHLEKSIVIDAPPDVVFPFLTDPLRMVQWCGESAELEPRPGGVFKLTFEGGVVSEGRYEIVDPPRRVVFTVGMSGSIVPVGGSRVEIELIPEGRGTRLLLRHTGFDPSHPVSDGWDHHLGRLQQAVVGRALGADRFVADTIGEQHTMDTRERSAELAVGWLEAWMRFDMDWLRTRLAPDFTHTSPFGRFEDRESYLAAVEPMARKSVVEIQIKHVISTGDQAAVWFTNVTPQGGVESCDWVRIEGDVIKAIQSFYDTATVRAVLSPSEQRTLDGAAQQ
ncbi:MAG: SRPBCC domain-containing protein [Gemmatimonadota bacterium]